MVHFHDNAPGLKVIVAYKLAKAALMGVLGLVLLRENLLGRVEGLAVRVSAWFARTDLLDIGNMVGAWIARVVTPQHVHVAIALILLDAASTAVEGIGLHYRQRWAAWLVVVATGALVPFELHGLYPHPTPLRLLVLAVNLAILGYLAWKVLWAERREAAAA